jgi:hypothetical protein
LRSKEFFIAKKIWNRGGRHVCTVSHGDEAPYRFEPWSQLLYERGKTNVKEEVLVFRMIDDVLNLLKKQARIDGVQHRSHTRGAEKQFQVPVTVPGHGADAVTLLDPEGSQSPCELPGTTIKIRISAAVRWGVRRAGNNWNVRMGARGMFDQGRNQQRMLLHQTEQDVISPIELLNCAVYYRDTLGKQPSSNQTITRRRGAKLPASNRTFGIGSWGPTGAR